MLHAIRKYVARLGALLRALLRKDEHGRTTRSYAHKAAESSFERIAYARRNSE